MMSSEFIETLPRSFRAALEHGDFGELLRAAEASAPNDPGGTAIVVWKIAVHADRAEALQVLSYLLVRHLSGSVAEACRLWLMQHQTADLATLVNILNGLGVMVVEGAGLADYHLAALHEFLFRCLAHEAPAVKISVLDFLRDYAAARGWPRRIGRTAARQLAEQLRLRLSDVAVEEEIAELASVASGLESGGIPSRPDIDLVQIEHLVSELENRRDAAELAAFVRERRLYAHAQWQAQRDKKTLLTVRVLDDRMEGFLSLVRQLFGLCRLDNTDRTPQMWLIAPAASKARHLRGRPETTCDFLERLRIAVAIADQEAGAVKELATLPPRQAGAVASLLLEARDSGIEAEFISTPPDIGNAQCVLALRKMPSTAASWHSAAVEAVRNAKERPEIYSDEIPQANTVRQVLQAVEAMSRQGKVVVADIDNISSERQVLYYTQAARVLGFLDDESNLPTPLGRELAKKSREDRFRMAAAAFESSMVGSAWCAWARVDKLVGVEPQSAEAFLRERARGISGSTIPRRASTLRGWHQELLPFYG